MITHTSNKSKLMAAVSNSAKLSMSMHTWGYSIQTNDQTGYWARLAQALAGGTAFVSAGVAVGIWIFHSPDMGPELLPFKMAFTAMLVLLSVLGLWFATQGTDYELQVDSKNRELREVLRNNKGQSIVVRRLSFKDISSVIFQRDASESAQGYANLIIRLKSQTQNIHVVFDKEANLEALREILAQDILKAPEMARSTSSIAPRRVFKRQDKSNSAQADMVVAGE